MSSPDSHPSTEDVTTNSLLLSSIFYLIQTDTQRAFELQQWAPIPVLVNSLQGFVAREATSSFLKIWSSLPFPTLQRDKETGSVSPARKAEPGKLNTFFPYGLHPSLA
jgi:hypothetical protein